MRQEKKTLQEGEEVKEGGWGQGHRFGTGPDEFNSIPFLLLSARHSCSSKLEGVFFPSVYPSLHLFFLPQLLTFQSAYIIVRVCVCVLFFPGQRGCRTCDNDCDNDCNEDFFHKVAHAALPSSPNLHSDVSWLLSHLIHTHTHTSYALSAQVRHLYANVIMVEGRWLRMGRVWVMLWQWRREWKRSGSEGVCESRAGTHMYGIHSNQLTQLGVAHWCCHLLLHLFLQPCAVHLLYPLT